jgi:ferredoxin
VSLVSGLLVGAALLLIAVAAALISRLFGEEDRPAAAAAVPEAPARRAAIACAGAAASAKLHPYRGLADCRIVRSAYGGDRLCRDACLGYGTCVELCPRDAIVADAAGRLRVTDDCDGCGLCAAECPAKAILMLPGQADHFVRCNSSAPARDRSAFCASACTACAVCLETAPSAGYSIRSGLAAVDYRARGDRRLAVRHCPVGCIVGVSDAEAEKKAGQGADNGLEWANRPAE